MEKFSLENRITQGDATYGVTDSSTRSSPDFKLNLRFDSVDIHGIDTNGSNEICLFSKPTFLLPSTNAKHMRTEVYLM